MSIVLTDNNYSGDVLFPFVLEAFSKNRTIQDGHVYIQGGINKKAFQPIIRKTGNNIQAYSATPSAVGGYAITERELTPQRLLILEDYIPQEMRDYWPEYAPAPGQPMLFTELPAELKRAMIETLFAELSWNIAQCIWAGKKTGSPDNAYPNDQFDGLLYQAINGSCVDVSGTSPAAITSSNIKDILDDVYNAIPLEVRGSQDMKIFMSTAAGEAYRDYLIGQTYKGADVSTVAGLDGLKFKGKQVISLDEFPVDIVYAAKGSSNRDSNLALGVTNVQNTELFDMGKKLAYQDVWFLKMIWSMGAQVWMPEYTVIYNANTDLTF